VRLPGALKRAWRWLPWGRDRFRAEIHGELEAHLAQLAEDDVARGVAPDDARRAARLRFGNAAAIADRCQDERRVFRLEQLLADLRFGLRLLRRSPGFTLVAVVTLGLGIGANTAIFSLVHGVLLARLPFHDPDRLLTSRGFSIPDYEDLRQQARAFDRTAIWASNLYTVVTNGEAEQIPGIVASPELFAMLGEPLLGRAFLPGESSQPLAILDYDFWQARYEGSPSVLGRTLDLGGRLHTIVGVMPRGFHFPSAEYKFWVTFDSGMSTVPTQRQERSLRVFRVVARLRPGVTVAQAKAELVDFSERQARLHPDSNREVRFELRPILESMVGQTRVALLVLLGTVGLVLLIACANVASMLLARTASRRGELAVRTALGATRGRLVRQLLCESLVVSAVGGAVGLLLAETGLRWLRSWPSAAIPRLDSVQLNLTVLAFTFSLSMLTGLIFGVLPAFYAAAPGPLTALKEGGRTVSPLFGRRLRPALVVLEIGLAMVVTVGAGLLVRSLITVTRVDPGFAADHLTTGSVLVLDVKLEERPRVVGSMLDEIARLPGVERAGAGTGLPPQTAQRGSRYELPQDTPGMAPQSAYFLAVTPDFLPALGTRLLAGRAFGPQDTATSERVVLISDRLARSRFEGRTPIGDRLRVVNATQSPEWRTIVGVVADVRYSGLEDSDAPAIYTPYPQNPQLLAGVYLMVRSRGEGASLYGGIRRAVEQTAPGLHAVSLRPMSDVVEATVSSRRLNTSLLSLFSLLALVLSATGIYGLVSYAISQRSYEIGVRMALGAGKADVVRLVLRHVLQVVGAGLTAGLLGSVLTSRVLGNLLFEVQPTDPTTFVSVALTLVAVGLAASYVPVRRATRIDPVRTLRSE
jgi:putative ABC transport system permease protein